MAKKKNPEVTLTAKDIIGLLAERHKDDVFVPECKDGPTQGTTHFRLDAWVMAKSWAHQKVTWYEVKVSRSDFDRDDKWPAYLPCCNSFYFVCPAGLIDPAELPPEAGLLTANPGGTKLYARKCPTFRNVEIPDSVFRYILMCRATIGRNQWQVQSERPRDYWQNWLKQKDEDRELGASVGAGIRRTVQAKVIAVNEEKEKMQRLMSGYDGIRTTLRSLGFDPDNYHSIRGAHYKLAEITKAVPADFERTLDRLIQNANQAKAAAEHFKIELEALKAKANGEAEEADI